MRRLRCSLWGPPVGTLIEVPSLSTPIMYADGSTELVRRSEYGSVPQKTGNKLVRRLEHQVGTQMGTTSWYAVRHDLRTGTGVRRLGTTSFGTQFATICVRLRPKPRVTLPEVGARPRTHIAIWSPALYADRDLLAGGDCKRQGRKGVFGLIWGAASEEGQRNGRREGDTMATESLRVVSFVWHHRGSLHRAIFRGHLIIIHIVRPVCLARRTRSLRLTMYGVLCCIFGFIPPYIHRFVKATITTSTHSFIPSAVRKVVSQNHIISCSLPVHEAPITP